MTKSPRTPAYLLAAAGLAWTVGQAVLPDMGLEMDERFAAVAGNRGTEALSTGLLAVAGCLLVLSALSITRTVSRRPLDGSRGARLLRVGAALLALGGVWLVAGRAAFNMAFLRATHPDVSREAGMSVLQAPGGFEFLPLLLTLPALLLGPVLLAVGARRAGLSGWLPVLLWVVGIGTFIGTEFTVKVGEVLGVATASVGLVLLGLALSSATGRMPENNTEPGRPDLAETTFPHR